MAREVATGLRLNQELADEIDKLAKADNRPRAQYIINVLIKTVEKEKAYKAGQKKK